mmetsp:Transcript_15794/g.32380  ORF Transcript_15794/g.32380 Transcript_15794/m.32380 type:complete len:88 (-) Transcript_15794:194-457(-)
MWPVETRNEKDCEKGRWMVSSKVSHTEKFKRRREGGKLTKPKKGTGSLTHCYLSSLPVGLNIEIQFFFGVRKIDAISCWTCSGVVLL